jgi:hypothetical protein
MHATRPILASIVLLPLFLLDSAVFAQTTTRRIAIVESPTVVDITIPTGVVQVFQFDGPIVRYDEPASPYFRFLPPSGPNELRIEVRADAHNAVIKPAVVVGKHDPYKVTFNIRASRYETVSTAIVSRFDPQIVSKLQYSLAEAMTALDEQEKLCVKQVQSVREETDERMQDNSMRTILTALGSGYVSTTLSSQPSECTGSDVVLCGLQWADMGNFGVLRFVAYSHQDLREYRDLKILDDADRDHAIMVSINGADPVPAGRAHFAVEPLERAEVAVIVTDPVRMGTQVRVSLSRAKGVPDFQIIDLRPQKPPPPTPPVGFGRITIRVQPSFGAVWLANPIDKEELDATTIMGLGVRGSYALHKMFAVEADLTGIQSNDASFNDVPVAGRMGDILRSTKGARVLFGGAFRIGTKYQPFVRGGFGAQVVDHDVRFATGQGTTTGPGDGLSFNGTVWFGSGLDIQLGQHWTAGAGLSAMFYTAGTQSVEGGVQLGYGWGGYVRD